MPHYMNLQNETPQRGHTNTIFQNLIGGFYKLLLFTLQNVIKHVDKILTLNVYYLCWLANKMPTKCCFSVLSSSFILVFLCLDLDKNEDKQEKIVCPPSSLHKETQRIDPAEGWVSLNEPEPAGVSANCREDKKFDESAASGHPGLKTTLFQ